MRRKYIYIIAVIVLLSAIFISMYVMNIYEVVIEVTPKELFADSQSIVVIKASPVNAFGMKIPFRKVAAQFEITSGRELIDIIHSEIESGKMILKSKNKTGIVTILIKPEKALLPSEITIPIYSNITQQ